MEFQLKKTGHDRKPQYLFLHHWYTSFTNTELQIQNSRRTISQSTFQKETA